MIVVLTARLLNNIHGFPIDDKMIRVSRIWRVSYVPFAWIHYREFQYRRIEDLTARKAGKAVSF